MVQSTAVNAIIILRGKRAENKSRWTGRRHETRGQQQESQDKQDARNKQEHFRLLALPRGLEPLFPA